MPIGFIACLVYVAFAQEAVQEKVPDVSVGSLSTQEIEEQLQVHLRDREPLFEWKLICI